MQQVILGKSYGFLGGDTSVNQYSTLRGSNGGGEWYPASIGGEFLHSTPWSVPGVFMHFFVRILAPVENPSDLAWNDITFEILKNNLPTGLTVTVPAHAPVAQNGFASQAVNLAAEMSISPGDRVGLVRYPGTFFGGINGTFAHIEWSITFVSTNTGESGYGLGSLVNFPINNSNPYTSCPLNAFSTAFFAGGFNPTEPQTHSLVPMACALFRYDIQLDLPPGLGESRTFVPAVDGVEQDGTGGTTDARLTISDLATTGFALCAVPLQVLNRFSVYGLVPSGSPAMPNATLSVGLRAVVDGQSALCMDSGNAGTQVGTDVDFVAQHNSGFAQATAAAPVPPPAWRPDRWPTTELLISLPGGVDPFSLQRLCVNLVFSPGSNKSYTCTTRVALATPANTPTNTLVDADILTVGAEGQSADFTSVDSLLTLQVVGSGGQNSTAMGWAWLMVTAVPEEPPPPPPEGCVLEVPRLGCWDPFASDALRVGCL